MAFKKKYSRKKNAQDVQEKPEEESSSAQEGLCSGIKQGEHYIQAAGAGIGTEVRVMSVYNYKLKVAIVHNGFEYYVSGRDFIKFYKRRVP